MKFSERIGVTKPKLELQIEEMDAALRNSIWSALDVHIFTNHRGYNSDHHHSNCIVALTVRLYVYFFKLPTDSAPNKKYNCIEWLRDWYFRAKWFDVYNFIEALVSNIEAMGYHVDEEKLIDSLNQFLEAELSAYRFVAGRLAPITNQSELFSINEASEASNKFKAVGEHIQTAVAHFSNRQLPDYRNSIKESISAVEAIATIISGKKRTSLGDALKLVDAKHPLHPALKEGFLKIYGYTSDEGGIRHSLIDQQNVGSNEAYFMLVSCSAFCNYLMKISGNKS